MAAGDQQGPAPRGGGVPLWVWGVGIGGVVLFLWWRNRQGASSSAAPISGGVVTDPNTGFPVDPTTGLPFVTSQPSTTTDLATWATNAEKALVGAGFSPALASQSIYDYQAGNQLNVQESNAVNKALGLVGFPPVQLPFFGNIPSTPGNVSLGPAPKLTKALYERLTNAQKKLWKPWKLANGTTVYIPKTWPTDLIVPPSVTPSPIFSPVPTLTPNGSRLAPVGGGAPVVPFVNPQGGGRKTAA